VPGGPERKRRTISLGVCRTKSVARQRLREYLEREGVNSKQAFHQNNAPAITFRQQAEWWLAFLPARKRRPVKPATISGWRDALNAWVLPNIGDKLLSEVSNGVLRELVGKMTDAGLSPKTIVNYSQTVKLVVASALTDEGEQIYPRKWNHDFIGLPIVEKEKQHRPTVTQTELEEILASVKGRYRVFFALLAGTGLRIGEALALRAIDFGPDCRMLRVQRSFWQGQEQEPKTRNAIRAIDIPEALAQILREHPVGKGGLLFSTAQGRPLMPRNLLRVLHDTGKKVGFHAFRRFRLTWLRKNGVPKDLERFWMGHAAEEIGDIYSKLKDDVAFRQEWTTRIGLGFDLVHVGTQNAAAAEAAKVA
jgi:integrase